MGIVSFFEGVFNGIFEFFASIIKLVIMLIDGLIVLLGLIPQGIAYLTSAIAYAPAPLIPFMMITVTVSVVLFIIGRSVD